MRVGEPHPLTGCLPRLILIWLLQQVPHSPDVRLVEQQVHHVSGARPSCPPQHRPPHGWATILNLEGLMRVLLSRPVCAQDGVSKQTATQGGYAPSDWSTSSPTVSYIGTSTMANWRCVSRYTQSSSGYTHKSQKRLLPSSL